MKKLQLIILTLILIIAATLRLYRLSVIPPGVNRDEASIGYTAYSLLKTGRDEYGRFLPLSFQSFGDWKLPLYIYTTTLFVKIFGLSELAVRLPSAIAGILTVLL
ncbi:MAG: glycosyl transferase, partial [Patescibacteria group bacterium]